MKTLSTLILMSLVWTTNSFAGPKVDAFKTVMTVAGKTGKSITVDDLSYRIVRSVTKWDNFFFKLSGKKSVVIEQGFNDGAFLSVTTYPRKNNSKVFLNEQEEMMYLRIEMIDMDYRYAGELRKSFSNASVEDIPLESNSIMTVVEAPLFLNVMDEAELHQKLESVSASIAKIYLDASSRAAGKKTVLSKTNLRDNGLQAN